MKVDNKARLQVDFLAVSSGGSDGVVPDVDGAYVLVDTKNWLVVVFLSTLVLITISLICVLLGISYGLHINFTILMALVLLFFIC